MKKNLKDMIEILDKSFVIYNATNPNSITNNKSKKYQGLDVFYNLHKDKFSQVAFKYSLKRAKRLFGYEFTQ